MKSMKESIRIGRLIGDYLAGKPCSQELKAWREASEEHEALLRKLLQGDDLSRKLELYDSLDMDEEWQQWRKHHLPVSVGRSRRRLSWRWVAGAAAVLIPLLVWIGFAGSGEEASEPSLTVFDGSLVEPGRQAATLTVGGETYVLGQNSAVDVSPDAITVIDGDSRQVVDSQMEEQENCLSVPRGGEYCVTLEDGTRVWLNADSELRFPKHFARGERRVALRGEAYMEVATDKKRPFYIEIGGSVVHVTGTVLNICAYPDEDVATVTLARGGVQVERTDGEVMATLCPAEQLVMNEVGGTCQVRTVDLAEALAWHQGLFVFREEPLASIARQLGRWYNVEIEVPASLANRRYSGEMGRYKSIEPLLNVLRCTGELEFVETSGGGIAVVAVSNYR